MTQIKMGIIGLAGIADFHIKGVLKSNDAILWAFCDVNEEFLNSIADKYDIPSSRRYTNYVEMLKNSGVDAVSICTPNFNHFAIAVEAIKNKIPFAVEKPITLNSGEAAILKQMAEEIKLPNMICFSYRYKSAARYAKWMIEQGLLGRIFHVYIQYMQGWGIDEKIPLQWRFQKSLSGSGALGDLGSHMLDLTRFLVGDINKVCSHAGTFIKERKKMDSDDTGIVDVDDFCHIMAQIEGNISSTFAITRYAYGRGNYQRVEVYGSEGSLVYHLDEEDILEVNIPSENGTSHGFHKVTMPENFIADQMQSFFDIIQGKGDGLSATVDDGYINQKVIDGIIESFTEDRWVSLSST